VVESPACQQVKFLIHQTNHKLKQNIKFILAFYLAARNNISAVRLYEATSRLGGWISSENHDGYFFESAARTLRPKGETGNTTLELIQLLGIENKILPIKSDRVAGKFRLTWSRNQINSVTPEIDAKLKVLFGSEASDDENFYDYTVRNFDKELADYVISPMVYGICAGDAKQISAKFLAKGRSSSTFEPNELYKKANDERWTFYSLDGGLETLSKSIVANLTGNKKVSLNLDSNCSEIHFEEEMVKVTINGKVTTSRHVVSSLPGPRLASLIKHQHLELANELNQMKSASVAMVNLHFPSEGLLQQKGFGVFISSVENSPLLGIIFDSAFVDMKGTTLTVMIGEQFLNQNSDHKILIETALKNVKDILGISEKPDNVKVNILTNSFPLYTVGHYQRLERIKEYISYKKLPLTLCGQSYDGIGINEVILSSKNGANAVKI
jgi:protoporphyrinogen/coproporphyrinogen III oxidase